jgi:transposase
MHASPPLPYQLFVGIDWAVEAHQVCLLRPTGKPRQLALIHAPDAYARFIADLRREADGEAARIAVAIETPLHPLVDALAEAGIAVYSLNPKQLDRFRDRHSPAGAKDDRRDAFVLADALRSDLAKFHRVAQRDEVMAELLVTSRHYHTLREDLSCSSNRLWQLLQRCAPHLLALSESALDDAVFWDLLDLGLDPDKARTLRLARVETVLRRHRIRRFSAAHALALLRQPRLHLSPGTLTALLVQAVDLTTQARVTHTVLVRTRASLKRLLAQSGSLAETVDSLPGADVVVTATFLAEAAEALRERDLQALRTRCGTAPVTRRSGSSMHSVRMRRACVPALRDACWAMARTAVRHDPWAIQYYQSLIARGQSHNRALRSVADRLLARLVALLRTGTRWDPAKALLGSAAAAA